MCNSHHPSDISRRGLAGLLAAGAGLALAPLRASAQAVVADTLCIMCIDHKFVGDAARFFDSPDGPGAGKYDVVALAGASLAAKHPRAPGRPFQFTHTFAGLREQLLFAKQPAGSGGKLLHPDIKRVVVLDHLGCGAYKNEYGPMTPGQEIARHREVAGPVQRWLAEQMGLESKFWLIVESGKKPIPYPYVIG